MLRLYLYARVRVLMRKLHTGPRVQRAPGLPCALFLLGAGVTQSPGAVRAAGMRMRTLAMSEKAACLRMPKVKANDRASQCLHLKCK
jgi:hypothetical protein